MGRHTGPQLDEYNHLVGDWAGATVPDKAEVLVKSLKRFYCPVSSGTTAMHELW